MRIIQIILFSALFLSCNENGDTQNQTDWRKEYGIIKGTGIVAGEINLEEPWVDDTIFVYLRKRFNLDSVSWNFHLIGIDTIKNRRFLIKNIPSGVYCIATTEWIIVNEDEAINVDNTYTAFSEPLCSFHIITVKQDLIAFINNTAPGKKTIQMFTITGQPLWGEGLGQECNVITTYIELNKVNFENLINGEE